MKNAADFLHLDPVQVQGVPRWFLLLLLVAWTFHEAKKTGKLFQHVAWVVLMKRKLVLDGSEEAPAVEALCLLQLVRSDWKFAEI